MKIIKSILSALFLTGLLCSNIFSGASNPEDFIIRYYRFYNDGLFIDQLTRQQIENESSYYATFWDNDEQTVYRYQLYKNGEITEEEVVEEEPRLRWQIASFNNNDGTITGKVFEYWDSGEGDPLFDVLIEYLNRLAILTMQDFIWIIQGEASGNDNTIISYLAKCWYRREFQIYYGIYRLPELPKIYVMKIVCLDPELNPDDDIIGIFFQSRLGNLDRQRSIMKMGIRVAAPADWILQPTEDYEIFKLYYPLNPTLISMRYIQALEMNQDPSQVIADIIKNYKENNTNTELEYETTLEIITSAQKNAILVTIRNIFTEAELEVEIRKYFIVHNRQIFEIIIGYAKESLNEELENTISNVLNNISFN